jgi:radical S-adenosyl methionine domain-containing protein 2
MRKYGADFVDVLAVSCDSFTPLTLKAIGRGLAREKTGHDHLERLRQIRGWCDEFDIGFKLNTVACSLNIHETIRDQVLQLRPIRWKVFQCLLIEGENHGTNAASAKQLRDARNMVVSDADFEAYVDRNRCDIIVPESNELMRNSYLILDERMRLLNNEGGGKEQTTTDIFEDIECVLQENGFDQESFKRRGGEWATNELQCTGMTSPACDIEDLCGSYR